MDEASPGPPVAIAEGVDGLELRVADGRLRDGGKVAEVDERHQIFRQRTYPVFRRRRERCVGRAEAATADPVLVLTDDSCASLL